MLVYETLSQDEPRATIIGAGLALLGAPQAIRLVTGKKEKGGASATPASEPGT